MFVKVFLNLCGRATGRGGAGTGHYPTALGASPCRKGTILKPDKDSRHGSKFPIGSTGLANTLVADLPNPMRYPCATHPQFPTLHAQILCAQVLITESSRTQCRTRFRVRIREGVVLPCPACGGRMPRKTRRETQAKRKAT